MHLPRIFQNIPLVQSSSVLLDERGSHHLKNVLRCAVGETVIVFNGADKGEFKARIQKHDKKNTLVFLDEFIPVDKKSNLNLHLIQGFCRNEKMEFVIQKSVELGVTSITPILTEFTSYHLTDEATNRKTKKWQDHIVQACEQSGRIDIPILHPICHFDQWLSKIHSNIFLLALHPGAPQRINDIPKMTELSVCIGPEGGFSATEMEKLSRKNAFFISLGPRILRTETAGLAMLSIAQALWGDMGF